jgi:uncharacterized protein (DUF927 family)
MSYPSDYPSQKDDFDARKFLNVARSAVQSSAGAPSLKYVTPGEPRPPHGLNNLRKIEPIIGEIKDRSRRANSYITPSLFNWGGSDTKENVCGFWACVLDEDADNGKFVILPPGIVPTFTLQTSITGETPNRQFWFVFTRTLSWQEGEALLAKLYRKCGGDSSIKNIAQYFRIPGGLNHPTKEKINRGRSPEPQRVKIIGEGAPIDPDALSCALDAMEGRPEVAAAEARDGAAAVEWSEGLSEAIGLEGWQHGGQTEAEAIRKKLPPYVLELMAKTDNGKDGDRSKHCHHVTMELCEHGLSDSEIFAVSADQPFMKKFSERNAAEVCREISRTRQRWIDGGRIDKRKPAPKAPRAPMKATPQPRAVGNTAIKLVVSNEAEAADADFIDDPEADKIEKAEKKRAKKQAAREEREQDEREALDEAEAQAKAEGLPELPRGFRHTSDLSVEHWVQGSEKEPGGWNPLCTPVKFLGAYRDLENGGWGHLVEVKDPDGKWHRVTISHSQATKDHRETLSLLADFGLVVHGQNAKFKFLDLAAKHLMSIGGRFLCVSQVGWHEAPDGGDIFALPHRAFGAPNGEEIIFHQKGKIGAKNEADYSVKGTLEGWQNEVAALAAGNSRLVLAISAAFAGPFLRPLGVEGGGVHFVEWSSKGKSTCGYMATSVWGGRPLMRTWDSTDSRLEGTALSHCDTSLVMDELSRAKADVVARAAYALASGQGRGRSNSDASNKAIAKWRVLFISTGEVTLGAKIAESGGKVMAGQEARFTSISADAGRGLGIFEELHGFDGGRKLAEEIDAATQRHHGHAALEFLEKLTDDVGGAAKEVAARIEAFRDRVCPKTADGQVQRVSRRFALIAAAGELASDWGITGWASGEATKAAETCFEAWLDQRGGSGPQEIASALSRVRLVIEQHGASRFQVWEDAANITVRNLSGGQVNSQLGYVRRDQNQYLFSAEAFEAEVCKGLDVKLVCKALRQIDALDYDEARNQKQLRIPNGPRQRLYVIKTDRLFNPDDEGEAL